MDPCLSYVVRLTEDASCCGRALGGKGAKLAALAAAGFSVPVGFCVTTQAYERFLRNADLAPMIRMELERKPLDVMRWEELWDAALRIRSLFFSAPLPDDVVEAITAGLSWLGSSGPLVVRSSAPSEDDASRSFAGLHESVVGVVGRDSALDAVRTVWASLFSDAAILYRRELGLDPLLSRMAVVVQPEIQKAPSGVAFGRDPSDPSTDRAVIEAVPGPCGDLVDGLVDPDRWLVDRASAKVLAWRQGDRGEEEPVPILDPEDVRALTGTLKEVECLFGWPPDIEWTGRAEECTLLQARPITTTPPAGGDDREWYLSLRPSRRRLHALAQRVSGELIPELAALGERMAGEPIDSYDDVGLASAIAERDSALDRWRQIYHDEFIPFAHGVRQLGVYYNDAVHPDDPYEFVKLLRGQDMIASRRNRAIVRLAHVVSDHHELGEYLEAQMSPAKEGVSPGLEGAQDLPGGRIFVREFRRLLSDQMDVAHGGSRLADNPELIVATIVKLARRVENADRRERTWEAQPGESERLEQALLEAVGPARQQEAEEVLALGRLSWKLRDDDNLLLGRVEGQLLRAISVAIHRLTAAGRLPAGWEPHVENAPALVEALRDPSKTIASPTGHEAARPSRELPQGEKPRQLVGQPASRGLATGRARRIVGLSGMAEFNAGEVMVCDAIEPTMTHLVPLAAAIVERRGGMLIHGAIIARELGIPCVNGVRDAVAVLDDGEIVTVDGYLGIVTVGPAEFGLEGIDDTA